MHANHAYYANANLLNSQLKLSLENLRYPPEFACVKAINHSYDYDGQTCERFSPYILSSLPAPLVLSSRSGPSISFAVCPSLSLNISLILISKMAVFVRGPPAESKPQDIPLMYLRTYLSTTVSTRTQATYVRARSIVRTYDYDS